MFNENVEQTFVTGASEGSSVYRACKNGTIRAKTVENEIHIRIGKNIYFMQSSKADEALGKRDHVWGVKKTGAQYTLHLGENGQHRYTLMLEPTNTHSTPVDLYLRSTGRAEPRSGIHIGHNVVGVYSKGTSKISEAQINNRIDAFIDNEGLIKTNLTETDPKIVE